MEKIGDPVLDYLEVLVDVGKKAELNFLYFPKTIEPFCPEAVRALLINTRSAVRQAIITRVHLNLPDDSVVQAFLAGGPRPPITG